MADRRKALVVASVVLLPATVATGCDGGHAATGATAEASKAPEVHTDAEPLAGAVPKLGRIVEAHWQEEVLGVSDSRAIGPTDYRVSALLQLGPGAVAALTESMQMTAVVVGDGPERVAIPAGLAGFVPAGVRWLHSGDLDRSLVRADSGELYFDLASDTAYLSAVNLHAAKSSSSPASASP
ncbi:hypothetical protein [Kitasatospora sp. NPDC091207]|uniref:hypothetical protein n=1 Tax=Kitasatospora sp. NPDC091207 TaxID=3364083 RepID=UPI003826F5F5